MYSAFLSIPAARPSLFGKVKPITLFSTETNGVASLNLKSLKIFREFNEIECAVSGGNKLNNGINLDINL